MYQNIYNVIIRDNKNKNEENKLSNHRAHFD